MTNEEIQRQLKEILEKNVWGYVCEDCGGGGRDHENDRNCIKCDGTGVYNWQYDLGVKKIIDLVETIKREAVEDNHKEAYLQGAKDAIEVVKLKEPEILDVDSDSRRLIKSGFNLASISVNTKAQQFIDSLEGKE